VALHGATFFVAYLLATSSPFGHSRLAGGEIHCREVKSHLTNVYFRPFRGDVAKRQRGWGQIHFKKRHPNKKCRDAQIGRLYIKWLCDVYCFKSRGSFPSLQCSSIFSRVTFLVSGIKKYPQIIPRIPTSAYK
jgi:hypothetical protein